MVISQALSVPSNIFETINPNIFDTNLTRISNRGKFMNHFLSQALAPSTSWLKLIFTELFDTARGY